MELWAALLAVLGTLAASLGTFVLQDRAQQRRDREANRDQARGALQSGGGGGGGGGRRPPPPRRAAPAGRRPPRPRRPPTTSGNYRCSGTGPYGEAG